ncbi:MAG: putative YigZ family protein [Paraglaciecola sp.]|jgi:uncharacterized YigZ family protein
MVQVIKSFLLMLQIMKDEYKTISAASEGEFRDRGSKFFAYAFPIYTEKDFQNALEEVKKMHPKARHFCYAYRIGLDRNNFRANDDGEPSGTAGKPILGQFDSFSITNVFTVVVRYFGGTLLGASGLINAYRTSTANALENADIIEKTVEDIYKITFDYSLMSNVMNAVKKLELEMVRQDFGEIGVLEVAIRQGEKIELIRQLRSKISGIRIEEIDEVKVVAGLKLDYLYTR